MLWLQYLAIGIELAFLVVGGIIIGNYVDKWTGVETPWFTIIGLIAGMISGFTLLIRMTKRIK